MGNACTSGIKKAVMGGGAFKVCVCGGAGGIGQPLSLLMSMDPNVKELSVFDLNVAMVPPAGVAADLNHIESRVKVEGYVMEVGKAPKDYLRDCLTGCNLVLIPAGMPRKPGMTRDDLFKVNADIAKGLMEACAKYCPEAVVALIANPVNSIVPAMAELYAKKGLNPMKIVGVTNGSATLSMAYAGARLGKSILAGLAGQPVVECAYVKSDITELPYFTSKVQFGKGGVVKVLPIGTLNDYETKRLAEAKAQLKTEIETGLDYAKYNELNLS